MFTNVTSALGLFETGIGFAGVEGSDGTLGGAGSMSLLSISNRGAFFIKYRDPAITDEVAITPTKRVIVTRCATESSSLVFHAATHILAARRIVPVENSKAAVASSNSLGIGSATAIEVIFPPNVQKVVTMNTIATQFHELYEIQPRVLRALRNASFARRLTRRQVFPTKYPARASFPISTMVSLHDILVIHFRHYAEVASDARSDYLWHAGNACAVAVA